jgi:hypothetical protein
MRHDQRPNSAAQLRYNEARQQRRDSAQEHESTSAYNGRLTLKPFNTVTLPMGLNYLVKGVLPRVGLVVIWGPPKCGKSFWTFDLVMHIALGRMYRGRKVQGGTVVYLALEGGSGFAGRIEAWRQRHLAEEPDPVPFFLLDVPIDLIGEHKELIAAIRAQVADAPVVVVVDTLNRAIVGDENKSDDMSKFIRAADAIRLAFGCLIVIIHHCGIAKNRPRGHTSLAGADDAQIAVEKNKDGIITAVVEHARDTEAGAKFSSKLERVELGTDIDGDELSSCVIAMADPAEAGPKLPKTQGFAFTALERLIETQGIAAPAEARLPEGTKVCLSDTWRKEFYATYPAERQDTKKKALLRATLDLEQAGLIVLWREYVWLKERDI